MQSDSFLRVLDNARNGDEQAFGQLIDRFRSVVDGVCRKIDLPTADLSQSDLKQEVWSRVWEKLDSFGGSSDDEAAAKMFAGWLKRISRNITTNIIEKRTAKKRHPEETLIELTELDRLPAEREAQTPSQFVANHEEQNLIRERMRSSIDDLSQEILTRYFEGGLTFKAIAEETGLSADSVRLKFHESIKKLSKY